MIWLKTLAMLLLLATQVGQRSTHPMHPSVPGRGLGGQALCAASTNVSRDFERNNSEWFDAGSVEAFSVPTAGDFWFSAWVQIESGESFGGLLGNYDGGDPTNSQVVLDWGSGGGILSFRCVTGSTIKTLNKTGRSTGVWYFVYAQYNNITGNMGLSIDNEVLVEQSVGGAINAAGLKFAIGAYNGAGTADHDGLIQQVLYGTTLLTTDERDALYNSGSGIDYAHTTVSPANAWRLNESSGNALDAVGGVNLTDTATVGTAAGKFLSCATS